MKYKSVLMVLAGLAIAATVLAQVPQKVLVLRGTLGATRHMVVHPTTRDIYVYLHFRGLSIFDTTANVLYPIAGTDNPDYEYGDEFVPGAQGSLTLSQHTAGIGQVRVIDSTGALVNKAGFDHVYPGGPMAGSVPDNRISLDDGATSIPFEGVAYLSLHAATYGLAMISDVSSPTLLAAHRSSPDSVLHTPIRRMQGLNSPERLYVAAYGADSLMWFMHTYGKADTICRARLGEDHCLCDTMIAGRPAGVLFLQSDDAGNIFYVDTSGRYARYSGGAWEWMPVRLPLGQQDRGEMRSLVRSHEDLLIVHNGRRKRYDGDPSIAVKIPFGDYRHPVIDTIGYPLYEWRSMGGQGMFTWVENANEMVWIRSPHEHFLFSSLMASNEQFPLMPIVTGMTRPDGQPLVVTYTDVLCAPDAKGRALLVEPFVRGYNATVQRIGSWLLQDVSRRGILVPARLAGGIAFPGQQTMLHDADGHYVRILDSSASTCVASTPVGDIVIGTEDAHMIVRSHSGERTVVDLVPVLAPSLHLDSAGYVSHILVPNDSTLVVMVSSRLLFDTAAFANVPYETGGIVRSTNHGRTWQRVQMPVDEAYFVAAATTPGGAIVVSATQCVVDTSVHADRIDAYTSESQTTTMTGSVILRSTDAGATWAEVHRSGSSRPMRMVGGYGAITDSGTVVLPVMNDLMESRDDGRTWSFHEAFTGDNGVISVFRHDGPGPVHYCTEQGLYRQDAATDVHDADVVDGGNFGISAEPRFIDSEVRVTVFNAANAVGGIRTLRIVDLLGNTQSELLRSVRTGDALNLITVDTSGWPRGAYYLVVSDDRTAGTINLMKVN